jgi:hypothetical protein
MLRALKRSQASRVHAVLVREFLCAPGVDRAPLALGLAWGESKYMGVVRHADADTVNPAKTESFVHCFRIGVGQSLAVFPA